MSFGLSAVAIGGIAAGVGAVGGAYISGQAAKSAASDQANAADYSADLQNQQWQQTQQNLAPYLNFGTSAINPLQAALGYNSDWSVNPNSILQQQFSAPTEAQAQATPGYQFTLNQGLKSTQNSAAARGLATSGAALKGASTYATGLADSTYNDVYSRALSTFNTNFNTASTNAARLTGVVGSGQNAASGLGALGAQTSANIGNTLQSGAQSTAAGTVGSANALSGAIGSIGNNALTTALLTNNAGGASGSAPAAPAGSNPYGFTVNGIS